MEHSCLWAGIRRPSWLPSPIWTMGLLGKACPAGSSDSLALLTPILPSTSEAPRIGLLLHSHPLSPSKTQARLLLHLPTPSPNPQPSGFPTRDVPGLPPPSLLLPVRSSGRGSGRSGSWCGRRLHSYSCRADPGHCWEPGGNWGKIDFRESEWECVNQLRESARQHIHASHSRASLLTLRSQAPHETVCPHDG